MGKNTVKVGIGIFIRNNEGKFLYGLRKSKHENNTYSTPGGHLEYGETIEESAIRELYEETGLIAKSENVEIFSVVNEIYPNNKKHYISIITIIEEFIGTVENKEPLKIEQWNWLSWLEIKSLGEKNLLSMQNFIKKYPHFDPTK